MKKEKGFGELFSESWNEYISKIVSFIKINLIFVVAPIFLLALIAVAFMFLFFGAAISQDVNPINYLESLPLGVVIGLGVTFVLLGVALSLVLLFGSVCNFQIAFSNKKEESLSKIVKDSKKIY